MAAIRQAMRRLMPATWVKSNAPTRASEQKVVLGDYYAALASSGLYSAYRARPWPVERAVAEAYERVVWIYKAVEAISSSSSQLTFQLKKGEDVLDDHPLYRVLNKRANPLETGRQFRKRLSAQVLLSKKGAFVEVTRSRGGDVLRMDLLPPGRTTPIPGTGQDLLSHYEVLRVDGSRYQIEPENVRWFREPHPLDPYCGVTPLEAAGMSIELDFYARLYNVAFLKNDARPGGVIAVDGDIGPEEMDRIEGRFSKGATNAGNLTVINGEVSYIDLAAQPRDMQYETTSSISKKEILSAFGVPESVIGDASGRTWDNAEQEEHNYWSITMPPHLAMLTTGLDEDSEDDLEGLFDISKIEVLQRSAIARRAEAREEFDKGLIRIDEYRDLAGYELIDNEHSRSLYLPTGRSEVATNDADAAKLKTQKEEAVKQEAAAKQPPLVPGQAKPGQAQASLNAPKKEAAPASSAVPAKKEYVLEGQAQGRRELVGGKGHLAVLHGDSQPAGSYSRPTIRLIRTAENKAAARESESEPDRAAQERLEASLEAALAALMVRLTARAATRLSSPKARKHTRHWAAEFEQDTRIGTKALNAELAVDPARWQEEAVQAALPLLQAAAVVAAEALKADLTVAKVVSIKEVVASAVDGVVKMVGESAARQATRLVEIVNAAEQAGRAMSDLTLTVRSYAQQMASWARDVAVQAATATVNGARDAAARQLAADDPGRTIERSWRTRADDSVRVTHRAAGGQKRPLGEQFKIGETLLDYPGDPDGPAGETYGCRCWLMYRSTVSGQFVNKPQDAVHRNPFILAATGGPNA